MNIEVGPEVVLKEKIRKKDNNCDRQQDNPQLWQTALRN
jgi:hypothetical protein